MIIQENKSSLDCFALIEKVRQFYEDLSFSASQCPTSGLRSVISLDDIIFESCKSTLESIILILKKGHITDSFTLLRKFYDNVVLHIYCTVHLETNKEINLVDQDIENWTLGKKRLSKIDMMLSKISTYNNFGELWKLLKLDNRYKTIRNFCNDNVHNNYLKILYMNTDHYVEPLIDNPLIDRFKAFVMDLSLLHLAYLLSIRFYYMSSSDYIDHLELNMTPPKDSQYWVAPFVQTFFNEVIKKRRLDVAEWMIRNTSMQLE